MSPVKRLAPCWVCGGLISIRATQCPHCGEPEPGPYSFEKAEREHAEEMARLETNKLRQEQWLRENRLILFLGGVLFAIPLFFLLVDLFDIWWLLGGLGSFRGTQGRDHRNGAIGQGSVRHDQGIVRSR